MIRSIMKNSISTRPTFSHCALGEALALGLVPFREGEPQVAQHGAVASR